jgi:hypothetical protein
MHNGNPPNFYQQKYFEILKVTFIFLIMARFFAFKMFHVIARPAATAAAAAAGAGATALAYWASDDSKKFLKNVRQFAPSEQTRFNHTDDMKDFIGRLPSHSNDATVQKLKDVGLALEELNKLIGLDNIKKKVTAQLVYSLSGCHLRKDGSADRSLMNATIVAPPGSGKTSLAKALAGIYFAVGLVPTDKITMLNRPDLIKGFVGGTAEETSKKLSEGKGGVIVIDEAPTLVDSTGQGYGKESIDQINRFLTENTDTIVILCGYKEGMSDLLKINEGLARRFAFNYEIPEYTPNDLKAMFLKMCSEKEFTVSSDLEHRLEGFFNKNRKSFPQNGGDIAPFVLKTTIQYGLNSTHVDRKHRELEWKDFEEGFQTYLEEKPQYKAKGWLS